MNNMILKQQAKRVSLLLSLVILCLMAPLSLQAAVPSLEIPEEGVFQERTSGRMWQMERSRRLRTMQDVDEYLKTLNRGKYSDWRLPTQQELYELFTIFDFKTSGDVKIQLEGSYWLVGKKGEVEVGSWEIGDQCGPSRSYYKGKTGYVRAVRP